VSKTAASLRRKANRAAWVHRYLNTPVRSRRTNWPNQAVCRGTEPDQVTVRMCEGCPVRLECLQDAYRTESELPTHLVFLVRGGLPATARAAALTEQRRQVPVEDLHPLVALVMEADNHIDIRINGRVA
jgi:hypothetical protein